MKLSQSRVYVLILGLAMGGYAFAQTTTTDEAVTYQINTRHTGAISTPGLIPPLRIKWSINLNAHVSYPLIVNGKVYVVTGKQGIAKIHVYALDAATGLKLWTVTVPVLGSDWGGLAYENGLIFLVPGENSTSSGTMYAFDANDGHQIWSTLLLGETLFTSPPTAFNGMVYTGGAGVGGYVYGVRETDGTVMWRNAVQNGQNSSPAVNSGGVYVSYVCPQTYKFAPSTGFFIWHFAGPCEGGGGSTPVLYKGLLYVRDVFFVSGFNGEVFNSTTGTTAGFFNSHFAPVFWNGTAIYSQATSIAAVNLTSGTTIWTAFPPAGDTFSIAPIVANGVVYIGTKLGTLLGFTSGTGAQVLSIPMGAPMVANDITGVQNPLAGLGAAQGVLVVPASTLLVALGP